MEATDSGAVLGMGGEEIYHPVQCTECSTEVAVFDKDEVYHFFNILASHCWYDLCDIPDKTFGFWMYIFLWY